MNDTIVVNPTIHFEKPCIAGTRITVQNVIEFVREGISFENICEIITLISQSKIFRHVLSMRFV